MSEENEFDIREEVKVSDLEEDEQKYEQEHARLINHIKQCKIDSTKEEIKKDITVEEFNKYKLDFSNVMKELNETYDELDIITNQLSVSDKSDELCSRLENCRLKLNSSKNKLNNNIYCNSTMLIARCLP